MSNRTIDMPKRLIAAGFSSDALDEIVRKTAIEVSDKATREGLATQMAFLNLLGLTNNDVWKTVILDELKVGMTVDVSEPKCTDSPHSCSFTGTITKVSDEFVEVRDMEDNHFDISFIEIERFFFE